MNALDGVFDPNSRSHPHLRPFARIDALEDELDRLEQQRQYWQERAIAAESAVDDLLDHAEEQQADLNKLSIENAYLRGVLHSDGERA